MYIRLFSANDVFVVISLPKSFIYCLPIILFYPTYIFHGGYGFSVGAIPCYGFFVGAIPCDGFLVGAIPCGCPSSILFWSTVGESFLYGSTVLGIVFIWVDHEGRPYVIRYILVDGWGCHYGIRFNQCGNVNHSFSTICTVSFNIIIPFSICPNIHTLFWQDYGLCFCFRCGTLGACATTFSITILFCSLIYYWC